MRARGKRADTTSCARAVNARAPKTYGGWKIKGQPGNRRWVPPDEPPTAGRIARTRRVTAARATAAKETAKEKSKEKSKDKSKENRNLPQRT